MKKTRKPLRRDGASGYQVGPGTVVSLAYALFDAEGEKIEESEQGAPVDLLIGYGEVAPELERQLEGLSAGARRELQLDAEEAFGPRDPEALIHVDRADLPSDVALGDELVADRTDGGGVVTLKVVEMDEERVVLDTNPPLAGQRVRLVVRVENVRPATEEELAEAADRLTRSGPPAEPPLLPAERLLRRRRGDGPQVGDAPPIPGRPRRLA